MDILLAIYMLQTIFYELSFKVGEIWCSNHSINVYHIAGLKVKDEAIKDYKT